MAEIILWLLEQIPEISVDRAICTTEKQAMWSDGSRRVLGGGAGGPVWPSVHRRRSLVPAD
jgi:hypothetical protein